MRMRNSKKSDKYVRTFTGTDVRFETESIMMRKRRSYRWPVAREKTWILLSSSPVPTTVNIEREIKRLAGKMRVAKVKN